MILHRHAPWVAFGTAQASNGSTCLLALTNVHAHTKKSIRTESLLELLNTLDYPSAGLPETTYLSQAGAMFILTTLTGATTNHSIMMDLELAGLATHHMSAVELITANLLQISQEFVKLLELLQHLLSKRSTTVDHQVSR